MTSFRSNLDWHDSDSDRFDKHDSQIFLIIFLLFGLQALQVTDNIAQTLADETMAQIEAGYGLMYRVCPPCALSLLLI